MSSHQALLDKVFRDRLHSIEASDEFRTCADCKCDLRRGDRPFVITKDYNYGEVVLEYAICMDCNEAHQASWSEGSRLKVCDLFHQAAGVQREWEPVGELDPSIDGGGLRGAGSGECFNHCWMTGETVPLDQPFQVVTMVQSSEGLRMPSSFLLSHDGMELIQSSLSKRTRDERDRYKEKINPRAPWDWEDDPSIKDELELVGQQSSPNSFM